MRDKYILNKNGNPVQSSDLEAWAIWFETADPKVAHETVGDSDISTVFLGIDHAFNGGPPLIWESMVFGGKLGQEQDRCGGNREQAEAMHARMVEKVKAANNP